MSLVAISVFTSSSLDALADALAASLNRELGDPFRETLVLTPNLPLQRWLTYQLAERRGITANISFQFLEAGLWRFAEMLAPDESRPRAERLKREWIQCMIVAALLARPDEETLAPLFAYTGPLNDLTDRAAVRKLWQLAEQLSRLFREYESSAPALVQTWLNNNAVPRSAEPIWKAQRALYRFIFANDGLRDRLSASTGIRYQTTAEFAADRLVATPIQVPTMPLRIFCVSALGQAQMELLERLGEHAAIQIYHLDLLAGGDGPLGALVSRWGRAHAARRVWLQARETQRIPAPTSENSTRLAAIQSALRGEESVAPTQSDESLQVMACPGVRREVEAVRDAVVHRLETDPSLQLTDIGILVPDMTEYRPHLEAVFQRDDLRVPFNLSDTTAEDDSVYAQGVDALLALAGGRFTRREFFKLTLNPCFLAAQKISRDDVMQWLDWADRLNIFREFDAGTRADLRPFSWRHALRRLRLGRIMTTGPTIAAYQSAVPFGDLRSADPEAATRFSAVVERLARFCERCTIFRTAEEWSKLLQDALKEFVAVPEDRGEEEGVRSELLRALDEFKHMDAMLALAGAAPSRRSIAYPLLRELMGASIADVPSRFGHYLLDGVTISALRPDRHIPFRMIFVLGMGEGVFPGHDAPFSLEVRDASDATHRPPTPVEANRAALLEALFSARDRIVFSYVSRNLQKDETFEPSTLLKELSEAAKYATPVRTDIPFTPASDRYILRASETAPNLPSYRRHDLERALIRMTPNDLEQYGLAAADKVRLQALQIKAAELLNLRPFALTANTHASADEINISIDELARFLRDPLGARLRRHLGLYDDDREDTRALEEHEPFFSDNRDAGKMIRDALEKAVVNSVNAPIPTSASIAAQQRFEEQQWMGDAPSGEYGRLDLSHLEESITGTVERPFVCERLARMKRIAGVSIGNRTHGTVDMLAFPALELALPDSKRVVKISAQMAHVYQSRIGGPLEFLAVSNGEHKSKLPSAFLVQQWLFYMALSAGEVPGADGQASRRWMGDAGCNAWLLTSNGLKGWSYVPISAENARAYLTQLVSDYLDATRFEHIPLEPVLKICDAESSILLSPPPDLKYRVQRELDNAEGKQHGYSPPQFFRILNARAPDDSISIFKRRIAPFLSGLELSPETDLGGLGADSDANGGDE